MNYNIANIGSIAKIRYFLFLANAEILVLVFCVIQIGLFQRFIFWPHTC